MCLGSVIGRGMYVSISVSVSVSVSVYTLSFGCIVSGLDGRVV